MSAHIIEQSRKSSPHRFLKIVPIHPRKNIFGSQNVYRLLDVRKIERNLCSRKRICIHTDGVYTRKYLREHQKMTNLASEGQNVRMLFLSWERQYSSVFSQSTHAVSCLSANILQKDIRISDCLATFACLKDRGHSKPWRRQHTFLFSIEQSYF